MVKLHSTTRPPATPLSLNSLRLSVEGPPPLIAPTIRRSKNRGKLQRGHLHMRV